MSSSDGKKIRVAMILEVIGKPKEYLVETLENIIRGIGGEKGVYVAEEEINEPILMKEQKEFYTSFAEIEINVEEIAQLTSLIVKYMPAHVEIISPESIAMTNNGLNDILNDVLRKLHGYDEIARIIESEKIILEKKIRGLMENKEEKNDKPKEKN